MSASKMSVKNKSTNTNRSHFAATLMFLMLLQGILVRCAFSQAVIQDNAKAHLVQWTPFRVLKEVHQVKLFYEYQPAESKFSFGVAPSFSFGTNLSREKTQQMELQPFMNIIRRKTKSEIYAQFFLKATYLYQYDLGFETAEYEHPSFYIFSIQFKGGTYSDVTYEQENIFAFGGGVLAGFRKYFGNHWFMDVNGGLQ